MTYVPDQRWDKEPQRLAAMERLWDPGTQAAIEALGIEPGWRCLEAGAGAGSVAAWLARRVAPGGEVLATDLDVRHLRTLREPGLEVREHDLLRDPLPAERFDLIHARFVVEHLGGEALERLLPPLRPGGWLLLEAHDWGGAAIHPRDDRTQRAIDAMLGHLERSGFDREYGRKLVHELERAGLRQVAAGARMHAYRGGSDEAAFLRLSLESLGPALVGAGDLAASDIEHALAVIDDAGTALLSAPLVAAWGRR